MKLEGHLCIASFSQEPGEEYILTHWIKILEINSCYCDKILIMKVAFENCILLRLLLIYLQTLFTNVSIEETVQSQIRIYRK